MTPALHRLRFLVVCIGAFLLLQPDPSFADQSQVVPRAFVARLDTPLAGLMYRVELKEGTLLYRTHKDKKAIHIVPTPRQWREFRQAIDAINVWQWPSRPLGTTSDSEEWSLHIEYSDRSLTTQGAGHASLPHERAGPDGCATTKPFTRYRAALQKLLGGRPLGRRVDPLELFDIAELQLVATHPSPNRCEQWAAFRDPSGVVRRVWGISSGCLARTTGRAIHVGPASGTLREVKSTSASILELCLDADADWFERVTEIRKASAP